MLVFVCRGVLDFVCLGVPVLSWECFVLSVLVCLFLSLLECLVLPVCLGQCLTYVCLWMPAFGFLGVLGFVFLRVGDQLCLSVLSFGKSMMGCICLGVLGLVFLGVRPIECLAVCRLV